MRNKPASATLPLELREEMEALRPRALRQAEWMRQLLWVGLAAVKAARRSGQMDRRAKRGSLVLAADE